MEDIGCSTIQFWFHNLTAIELINIPWNGYATENTIKLRGAMIDGELHIGIQFQNKDDGVTTIKYYCL